jgi:RNA 3'-terminal phosphate cyclase (ATP)
LPALIFADTPSVIRIEGGTHNPMAPPFEFIERVYLPVLRRMGVSAEIRLIETGFAPAGGGIIECGIQPGGKLSPLNLHERGELKSTSLTCALRFLNESIAERMIHAAKKQQPCDNSTIEIREPGPGRGVCCMYEAVFQNSSELASACGEMQITSEQIGHRVGKSLKNFISSGAAVGRHLADQLLLPVALAGGGSFTTLVPDEHVRTNLAVIEKFLPVKSDIESLDRGLHRIEISSASQD